MPRMRKNSKSITTSPEIITQIAELLKMNFSLLTKLVPWLDEHEKAQRKFRSAVIGYLSRIEATASLIHVGQMAQTQRPQSHDKGKLDESAKSAEEFMSKQSLKKGVAVVKYIYKETPTEAETDRHDRRRKWTGWEI